MENLKNSETLGNDWWKSANCKESDRRTMYSNTAERIEKSREICRKCPVIQDCLNYALAMNEVNYGMYGVKTPAERKEMLKRSANQEIKQ